MDEIYAHWVIFYVNSVSPSHQWDGGNVADLRR